MGDQPKFIFPNPYGPPGTPADARKLIHFLTDGVQPPSSVYLDVNDQLNIEIWTTDITPLFLVTYRILNPKGEIIQGQESLQSLAAPRAATSFLINLTEGFLLSLAINLSAFVGSTRARGQNRARAQILRGGNVGLFRSKMLTQGMLDSKTNLDWPPGIHELTGYGQGFSRSVTGTTPAAGAEISETVPTLARWGIKTFRFQLTTSATVANRGVNLVIDDGVNDLYHIEAVSQQAASIVTAYNAANVGDRFDRSVTNNVVLPIPDIKLMPGWRIRTATQSLQATDQYTAPQYHVEEWFDQ